MNDSKNITSHVTVHLHDGRTLSQSVDHAKGITTQDELHRKYHDCAENLLASDAIDQSARLIDHLEEVDDMASLLRSSQR